MAKRIFVSLVVLALALLTLTILDVLPKRQKPHVLGGDPVNSGAAILVKFTTNIPVVIDEIIRNYASGDVYKVDFTFPGQPGFGDNPNLEVFNTQGSARIKTARPIPREHMHEITTDENHPGFMFTVANRVLDFGDDSPDLVAVFPRVRKEVCDHLIETARNKPKKLKGEQKIDLTPFPNTVPEPSTIELPLHLGTIEYGCILTTDGFYYVHTMLRRPSETVTTFDGKARGVTENAR